MRADRLLSLMMLLQNRGQMSARELADALEVSERTIYRDIDALSAAGVPVYGEPGRAGGYALLDSYRTTLTGLSDGEVRALFMLSIPAPLHALGVSRELKAALLKLSAALPASRREDEARVRQRIYLDSAAWQQEESPPLLAVLHRAVWQDRCVLLRYRPPFSLEIERRVAPYSLVAKAGAWYLVFAGGGRVRVQAVAELLGARMLAEPFERPADFDLAAFWEAWCARRAVARFEYAVAVRVAPTAWPDLPHYLGGGVPLPAAPPAPDAEGWLPLALRFSSLETARSRLLGLGGAVEVLAPEPLRFSLLDHARQIIKVYAP